MLPVIATDVLTGLFGFLFTVMILSYVVGDNPFFRFAIHVFVGVAAGYVTVIVWQHVIVNKLAEPMVAGDWSQRLVLLFPLVMSFFLLTKVSSKYHGLGRWVLAFLVGVGAAAAIAGALMGTLLPQAWASINLFDWGSFTPETRLERITEGVLILMGTIFTLAYFQFSVRESAAKSGKRGLFMRIISFIGEIFLAITFGALFAGVLSSALTAMVDRMQFIVNFFASLFP
jgi:hypothetical protein